nr:sulfurtransferase TusA family protein [Hansschlegelia zhihuaiae]
MCNVGAPDAAGARQLDLRGLRCPLPALKVRKALLKAPPGAIVAVTCDDPLARVDIPNLVRELGDELLSIETEDRAATFAIRRRGGPPPAEID